MSQAWPSHEMLSTNMQSRGHGIASGPAGGRSNGMNSAGIGHQGPVNGAPSGIGAQMSAGLKSKSGPNATPSQQPQVSMLHQTGPQGQAGSNPSSRPQGLAHPATTGTAFGTLQATSQGNGVGIPSIGQPSDAKPGAHTDHVTNVHATHGVGSNHMMRGQLPTYPASMQAGGTPSTGQNPGQAQAGRNSGLMALQPETEMGLPPVKASPSNPFGTGGSTGVASSPTMGSGGGNATGGGPNGGKERRGMGMGSLLNADRR